MAFPNVWGVFETLVIKGSPDTSGTAPLYVGPQQPIPSGSITLLSPAHPAADTTLHIGRTANGSGIVTGYIDGVVGGGPGSESFSSDTRLYISGTDGTVVDSLPNSPTLYLDGPPFIRESGNIPLNINGTPIVVSTGSGSMTFYASGAEATTTNPVVDETFATLYIGNYDEASGIAPLHLETDFNYGETTSLYVNSTISSGVATLEVEGANLYNSGISLFVRTPESGNITIFTKGFRS